MNPGICPQSEITYPKDDMYPYIIRFIGRSVKQPVADVGELNVKSQFLSKHYRTPITQIAPIDLDYYYPNDQKFETIFCFEVFSHLVNPGWCMSQLKQQLSPGGFIYLSMPARPRFMWNRHHYNEISPVRFRRWILEDMNLRIIRTERIRLTRMKEPLRVGVRPLLRWIARLLWNYTVIYEITRNPENL